MEEPQKFGDTMDTESADFGGQNGDSFLKEVETKLRPQDDTGKGAEKRGGYCKAAEEVCAEVWMVGRYLGVRSPNSHHGSANKWLCGLGQVLSLFRASISPSLR